MVLDKEEPLADMPPVIGYSTEGRLIRGATRVPDGRWLVTFVSGEHVVTQRPNALDRKILGAVPDDPVVVLWKSGEEARRYLARQTMVMSIPSETAADDKLADDDRMIERSARKVMGDSNAVIGYDPVDGRLIVGKYWDNHGNWVDALYANDEVMLVRPTELDRVVLGEDIEWTIVVLRNEWSAAERYRLAADTSFHCAVPGDVEREDEMLRAAAAVRF